jgi:hypothetical protein
MTTVKRCPRCGQLKSAAEFYRRRRGRGLSSYCQPCTRAATHQAQGRRRVLAAALGLPVVDRIRQRRQRVLGSQGGGER